jgi:hypothetical protein
VKDQRPKPLNTDKIFQVGRSQKLRKRRDNKPSDQLWKGAWTVRSTSSERRKHRGEEQIPSIGSEREGPTTIGSEGKGMRLNPCVYRRVDLSKSLKSRSEQGPSIVKEDRWREIHNFISLWTRRDQNHRRPEVGPSH